MAHRRLPITPPLLEWLRTDPAWAALPWTERCTLRWLSALGGWNAQASRAAGPPPAALAAPLLVLGPWRSGTTVLHELLVAATGWPTPRTWQCLDPAAFRLRRAPPAAGTLPALARPMDGLPIDALSPQEDEFALLGLGVLSAYRAFLMPHRLDALHESLDPAYWLTDDAWWAPWLDFLHGVLAGRGPQRLVLKSPNHLFRLRALVRRWPELGAAWVVREPAEVLASNRKMWRAMFDAYALTPADNNALDRFLLRALDRTGDMLQWAVQTMPRSQLVVVEHAALRHSPEVVARASLHRLGLPAIDSAAIARTVERMSRGRIDRYVQTPADDRAVTVLHKLAAAQQAALSTHGL